MPQFGLAPDPDLATCASEREIINPSAPVAQWIEHRPPKSGVAGSTPARGVALRSSAWLLLDPPLSDETGATSQKLASLATSRV